MFIVLLPTLSFEPFTHSLSYVPLVAPSTSLSRIKFLASIADTFMYIVSKVGGNGDRDSRALTIAADGDDRFV
jgi:tryptophan synthase alpha subunit